MTENTLTQIRKLSSADVAALLSIVTGPIILLNVFGGVGSAIWLAVLGEWSVLGQGLALAIFATLITLVVYLRHASALKLVTGLWPILAFPLAILLQVAASSNVTLWCAIFFDGFLADSQPGDFWPRLLWAYALASGSLIAASSFGDANGPAIKVFTTFFAQLAFVPMIIAVLFFKPTLNQLMMIFAPLMIVSCVLQLVEFGRNFSK